MTRIQRTLLSAVAVLVMGAGLAFVALRQDRATEIGVIAEEQDKRLFQFGRVDILKASLTSGTVTASFEIDDRGLWHVTAPVKGRGDQPAITLMLDHISGIKADAVAVEKPTPADFEKFKLNTPALKAEMTLKDGSVHTLLVGARNQMGGAYYITTGDKARVALAAEAFYGSVVRELFGYRNKQVVPFAVDLLKRVQVKKIGEWSYTLDRTAKGWTVTLPGGEAAAADSEAVHRFEVVLTRDLRVESFATDTLDPNDATALTRYGLDAPTFEFTVTGKEGDEIVGVLGASRGDIEGGPYMRLGDTGTVVSVYEAFRGDIDKPGQFFRDRRISSFDYTSATSVEMSQPGQPAAKFTRTYEDGEPVWRLVSPREAMASRLKIEGLLRGFARLRSAKNHVESATPEQRREWLLEPPLRKLVIKGKDGVVLTDVRIGNRIDEEHVFITAGGLERVDVVALTRLDAFPATFDHLVAEE